MAGKFVYSFNEGSKDMHALLGGKGANLAEMTKIGLPVPFGFIVTTEACDVFYKNGEKLSDEIVDEINSKLEELEHVIGKKFGDAENPLLVSVRSGAPISMPGMMDSILNLGINDVTAKSLAEKYGKKFALDCYVRFISMFGSVVMGIPEESFDDIIEAKKMSAGIISDCDMNAEDLESVLHSYKKLVREKCGEDVPQDPKDQLFRAINAVLLSWNNDRAKLYRKLNGISDDIGTAVNIQSMVFGNKGYTSGSGVAISRSPVTGDKHIYGEFLLNSQGIDVVSGGRTPERLEKMEELFPDEYKSFVKICDVLEKHFHEMQDMEFTIEEGKLYMLQTRTAKRTAMAAVNVAADMVDEELIDKSEAVLRVSTDNVEQLLRNTFDETEEKSADVVAKGVPASDGAVCGKICLSVFKTVETKARGEKAILVIDETTPEDLSGMVSAEGVVTVLGGITSHAAVVARGMGKCCVSGCSDIKIDKNDHSFTANGVTYREGDEISVNGATGYVYKGDVKLIPPSITGNFKRIMSWADDIRTLKVRVNGDTPKEVKQADKMGAEGVGLCRTEHMFFQRVRIPEFREMILAKDREGRVKALNKLLPYQMADFIQMFRVLKERPVTIRLLDPPLHEFLPNTENEMRDLADSMGMSYDEVYDRCESLREVNPMLGMRGCRLAVVYPEVVEMQTEAIISAAIKVRDELEIDIVPEIMIPLVQNRNEVRAVKNTISDAAKRVMDEMNEKIEYRVGTMIETPRAALTADELAEDAEFFSFGTNDMTQMTIGFSRDDTAELIKKYIDMGIMDYDPFKSIDINGVGRLIKYATMMGRKTRPNMSIGMCGEQGGDPKTIEFCSDVGLNYVSCSPYKVPVARLAAAHAAIRNNRKE